MEEGFYLSDDDEYRAYRASRKKKIIVFSCVGAAVLIAVFLILVFASHEPAFQNGGAAFNPLFDGGGAGNFFPYQE